ncbi:MAG: type IX secretion system protein PorQ [Bacteroidales bacterium]|nr:type IX secretion system protein PorQ [Bacteroidales bacterium]
MCSLFGARAQEGNTAYEFLNIPTSSHVWALGGTNITIIDDDVTLTDANPALIGPEIDMQVGVNYMLYMGSSNFAGVRFGMAAGEHGAWAAGIRYLNYGSMTEYGVDGVAMGSFSPQDLVVEGTWSHDIDSRLRGGINVKMVYSNYAEYSAFAMAADLGINYYNEETDLSFSAVLKNMGGQLKRFNKDYDRLPFDIQLGYMQGLGSSPFSVSIQASHLTKWKLPYYTHDKDDPEKQQVLKSNFGSDLFRHLIFGIQYQPSDSFYAALAYNYKRATDMSVYQRSFLSGFSIGLGLNVRAWKMGVSFAMPHAGASSLMLNLSCGLGELL